MTTHVLEPLAPFDFSHTLAFVRGFSPMHGEQLVDDTGLAKCISIDGRPVGFRVTSDAPGGRGLAVRLHAAEPLSHATRARALDRIEAMLGLRDDLPSFYAAVAGDGAFAPLTVRYRGLRHVRFPSAFEAACWGAINQRVSQTLARRWKDALTRRAGARVTIEGHEHWAFPEAAAVARLEAEELERLVPGGRRATTIGALARAFLDVDPAFLAAGGLPEVRAWLRAIPGVGPFTSSFVLYRGLGRFDGAPIVSPKLVAAANAVYRRRLDARDVAAMADRWGPWGGYWMLYLWASTFVPPSGENAVRNACA